MGLFHLVAAPLIHLGKKVAQRVFRGVDPRSRFGELLRFASFGADFAAGLCMGSFMGYHGGTIGAIFASASGYGIGGAVGGGLALGGGTGAGSRHAVEVLRGPVKAAARRAAVTAQTYPLVQSLTPATTSPSAAYVAARSAYTTVEFVGDVARSLWRYGW